MTPNNPSKPAPGPPEPPRIPGHMGYPRQEVISAARTVFGMLDILEEEGMNVTNLRQGWLRELERTGLREADLRSDRRPTEFAKDDMHWDQKTEVTIHLTHADCERLMQLAAFTYTTQDERILNALKTALNGG